MDEINRLASQRRLTQQCLLALTIICAINPCYAFSNNFLYSGRPIVAVGAGAAITSDFGNSQNFPAANPDTDEFYNYTTSGAHQTRAFAEIFAGEEWELSTPWAMQLGLAVSQIQVLPTNGILLQGMDIPSADQYAYHYSLLSRQLLIESKFLYQYRERFYPYLLLGIGAAFNEAYNYSVNVPPFTTFTRQYGNNTQTSFAYTAGFGIDTTISQNWRLGIGYRLLDLGDVYLGAATINNISVGGTLHQTHVYVNEVMAQLTWVT